MHQSPPPTNAVFSKGSQDTQSHQIQSAIKGTRRGGRGRDYKATPARANGANALFTLTTSILLVTIMETSITLVTIIILTFLLLSLILIILLYNVE